MISISSVSFKGYRINISGFIEFKIEQVLWEHGEGSISLFLIIDDLLGGIEVIKKPEQKVSLFGTSFFCFFFSFISFKYVL